MEAHKARPAPIKTATVLAAVLFVGITTADNTPFPTFQPQQALDALLTQLHADGKITGGWQLDAAHSEGDL